MAFLQPENIPSRNDLPSRLQVVARALRDFLPESVTVWLERTGQGETAAIRQELDPDGPWPSSSESDPYLVILDPSAGIVVLETPERQRRGNPTFSTRRIEADSLRAEIAQRAQNLRRDFDVSRTLSLPVVHVLAFPDTPRADLPRDVPVPVLSLEDCEPTALHPAIRRLAAERHRPLANDQEVAVRAAVRPSIIIGAQQRLLFRPLDDAAQIRTLDRQQERLAEHLGSGYRLIRGVAGSGKTLVLIHRARYIAEHFPNWQILLLCYNRALSIALAEEVQEADNVKVSTVDSLAFNTLRSAGRALPQIRQDSNGEYEQRRREAIAVAATLSQSQRYDMVLVDEAQDFGPSGLGLAWAMLKDERDNLVIALDGAQNVYRRRVAWNPPGMTARGRATVLRTNYRNTRQILELAQGMLRDVSRTSSTDLQSDQLDVLVMPDDAVRTGPLPEELLCSDLDAEARAIVEKVRQLRDAGVPAEEIVVLSGWKELRELAIAGIPDAVDVRRVDEMGIRIPGKTRIATLHWSKGLEFRHVIVGGTNHVWVSDEDAEAATDRIRRLLYVAMTRATETLTVTFSGLGPMDTVRRVPIR